jgi:hypothetical protein
VFIDGNFIHGITDFMSLFYHALVFLSTMPICVLDRILFVDASLLRFAGSGLKRGDCRSISGPPIFLKPKPPELENETLPRLTKHPAKDRYRLPPPEQRLTVIDRRPHFIPRIPR